MFLHAILSALVISRIVVACLQDESLYVFAKVLANQKERQDNIQGSNTGSLELTVTSFFCISIISACIIKKGTISTMSTLKEQRPRCKNVCLFLRVVQHNL